MIKLGKLQIDPVEYAINGNAILGIKDSGKSYTATVIAEQLFTAGIPFTVFDPTGIWRYLKVPGTGRGYPVVVAADKDGDFPLTVHTAPEIVRAAMAEGISLVLDLSGVDFSKADWRKIVTTCINVMLHENKPHGLRHLFIEEAAEFIPQRPSDPIVYAAVEKLARIGGNARLGYTLINQRSQEVAKSVLELCESVFLHRQRGKNALDNLSKWLEIASAAEAKEIIAKMPTLGQGECFAWIGGANPKPPVLIKVQKKTSMHPDRRALRGDISAGDVTPADASHFVTQMKERLPLIKKEREDNDPAALRKRIAELERAAGASVNPAAIERARAEGFDQGCRHVRSQMIGALAPLENNLRTASNALATALQHSIEAAKLCDPPAGVEKIHAKLQITTVPPRSPAVSIAKRTNGANTSSLPKGERAILTAIAQHRTGITRQHLTVLTGYKRSSRDAYIQRLDAKNYIFLGERLTATDEGRAALGNDYQPLPTGQQLQDRVLTELPEGERKILQILIRDYPQEVDRSSLGEESGYMRSSRDAYIQRLNARELIEVLPNSAVRASSHLF